MVFQVRIHFLTRKRSILTWFVARVVKQTFGDTSQTIEILIGNLNTLKQSFDSANIMQTVFVSIRTSENVEQLGLCTTR